jgi:hypothetical protein
MVESIYLDCYSLGRHMVLGLCYADWKDPSVGTAPTLHRIN